MIPLDKTITPGTAALYRLVDLDAPSEVDLEKKIRALEIDGWRAVSLTVDYRTAKAAVFLARAQLSSVPRG